MIQYDTPIEVTKTQYNTLMNKFAGIVAGREEDGKFYVKVWLMKYASLIEGVIQPVTNSEAKS